MLTLIPEAYSLLIRPLLFTLPPERAQAAADFALKRTLFWRGISPLLKVSHPSLRRDLCGLALRNPVGLAAGYDKDCDFLPSLAALGFGYVTGGTVTEFPQPGNPRPRVLRRPRSGALVNALGFPSVGLDRVEERLRRLQRAFDHTAKVVSVSGITIDGIERCHRRLEPLVDAVEINISSPNTAGLRVFQEPTALTELIGRVNQTRTKPLFVKLPPYGPWAEVTASGEARQRVLNLVKVCAEEGADAVTVANTRPVSDSRLAVGTGGLSGRPIFADTVRMVSEIKAQAGDKLAINACGGIFSGRDAWQALCAGATTVQILTGLVYRGPGIVNRINRELIELASAAQHAPTRAG